MQTAIPVSQEELTRQERLTVWMRRAGTSGAKLGIYANVTTITACRWLRADALPWHKVQVLRDFGVPEELLPEAEGLHGLGLSELPRHADA